MLQGLAKKGTSGRKGGKSNHVINGPWWGLGYPEPGITKDS